MKTYGGLHPQICSFENLWEAACRAQRGKRFQQSVAWFNFHRERELFRLQEELLKQTYRPGAYYEFTIYEPKKRLISAAPYRDRVVHHALCNVIEPIFERTFIFDSYACRVGKGTHRAVDRFTQFCRRHRYVLKADISKYFPSIDHAVLKGLIRRKIRDPQALWLIDLIIDSSNPQEPVTAYFPGDDLFTFVERRHGIPIGNLTSQFFANVYLNPLDHFVKEQLHCKCYIRYCDDFVVFADDKYWLHEVKAQIEEYLTLLRLKLHPRKCQVLPVKDGTDFLGYRIFSKHRRVRRDSIIRFRRRMRRLQGAYARGEIPLSHIRQSIQSWLGHLSHADSYGLRKQLLREIVFVRA
jgi:RNA-directed DNA polymerase